MIKEFLKMSIKWNGKFLIMKIVYYLKKSLFDKIKTATKFSFENDILEKHVLGLHFQGIIFDSYFIDIGVPEDYEKAQKYFK